MAIRRTSVVTVGMLLLAGCGGDEGLEGSLAGERFRVRSAIVGPAQALGQNNPPEGSAVIVLTGDADPADACDFERRRKEALQRGEPAPQRPAPSDLLRLVLDSRPFPPQSILSATYEVGQVEGGLRLSAVAFRAKEASDTTSTPASGGEVFIDQLPLRPDTVTKGRLSLRFPEPLQGELSGEFTATYCEHL